MIRLFIKLCLNSGLLLMAAGLLIGTWLEAPMPIGMQVAITGVILFFWAGFIALLYDALWE